MLKKSGGFTTPPKAGANLSVDGKSALIAAATSTAPKNPVPQLATNIDEAIAVMNEKVRVRLQRLDGSGEWQVFSIKSLFDLSKEGIEANSDVMHNLATAGSFLHDLHEELSRNRGFEEELDAFLKGEGRTNMLQFLNMVCEKLKGDRFDLTGFLNSVIDVEN